MHATEHAANEAVLRHGVEDPGLGHEQDEDDGAQARDGANLDQRLQPVQDRNASSAVATGLAVPSCV